jgi:hypothetical protein
VLQRPGPIAVFLAALTLLVGSGVAQAQSKPAPDNAQAAGPPQPDPSPAAAKRTQTAATPTTSRQPTPSPAPATSQPVAPVTEAPTRTQVPAPRATPTVQVTQPTVHHKGKAALAKPAARPHKPPVKKAQPKIVPKKPVVKARRPALKVPVAPATPASSPPHFVAAHGGFWSSLTLPLVLLLVGLMAAAAFVLVARGDALTSAIARLRARAMARRRGRAGDVAPWPPELSLEPVLRGRETPAMEDSDEWLGIQARIRAFSLSGPPGTKQPVRVETEKPASVEGGPEPEPIPSRGALPTDR